MAEEIEQLVKQVSLKNADLLLTPEYTRNIITSNKYQRAIALTEGWTGDRTKFLRCTVGGVLKTAPVATGLEEYISATTTLADNDFHEVIRDNDSAYARWDVLVETQDSIIAFRNTVNLDWGNEIVLTVGWHSIDLVSNGIEIKNRTAGLNTKYQIVGYR